MSNSGGHLQLVLLILSFLLLLGLGLIFFFFSLIWFHSVETLQFLLVWLFVLYSSKAFWKIIVVVRVCHINYFVSRILHCLV